jgi:hypothetical protein
MRWQVAIKAVVRRTAASRVQYWGYLLMQDLVHRQYHASPSLFIFPDSSAPWTLRNAATHLAAMYGQLIDFLDKILIWWTFVQGLAACQVLSHPWDYFHTTLGSSIYSPQAYCFIAYQSQKSLSRATATISRTFHNVQNAGSIFLTRDRIDTAE